MLSPVDYKKQIILWAKNSRWDLIRASSAKRLEAKGYIKLPMGSLFSMIHKDWFDKAKNRKLIEQNAHGQWLPVVHIDEVQERIGQRGTTPVYDSKIKLAMRKEDLDALNDFFNSYREWEKQNSQQTMDYHDVIGAFRTGL